MAVARRQTLRASRFGGVAYNQRLKDGRCVAWRWLWLLANIGRYICCKRLLFREALRREIFERVGPIVRLAIADPAHELTHPLIVFERHLQQRNALSVLAKTGALEDTTSV